MGWKPGVIAVAMVAAIYCAPWIELRAGDSPRGSDGQSEVRVKKPNADEPQRKFARGPAVTPSDKLVAWFERQIKAKEKSCFRVPLVLSLGEVGFSLRGARIGTAPDAVEVYANDAALGIGLASRAVTHCKGRESCAFWVEGRLAREAGGLLRLDVMRFVSAIQPDALASANYVEVEKLTVPEPAEPEQGFPIPKGARWNKELGGATSLAPGRNYTIKVYDIDFDMEAMTAFYDLHLPEAKHEAKDPGVTFSTPRGSVKLSRLPKGTRITLTVGPQ